jgi:hypothetical protein
MDGKLLRKIRSDISKTTIPDELKVLYIMANALELMNTQVLERIKGIYVRNGYRIRENELLSGLNTYCESVKAAQYHFQERVHPQICGATSDINGTKSYDWFNSDTNELCRLILLYIDRTARNNENFTEIFQLLKAQPSCGIFNDIDITKYTLNQ